MTARPLRAVPVTRDGSGVLPKTLPLSDSRGARALSARVHVQDSAHGSPVGVGPFAHLNKRADAEGETPAGGSHRVSNVRRMSRSMDAADLTRACTVLGITGKDLGAMLDMPEQHARQVRDGVRPIELGYVTRLAEGALRVCMVARALAAMPAWERADAIAEAERIAAQGAVLPFRRGGGR